MNAQTSKCKVVRYSITLEPGMKMLRIQCPEKMVSANAMTSSETRLLLNRNTAEPKLAIKSPKPQPEEASQKEKPQEPKQN